jgi:RNA-directed DNA polymerase
MRQWVSSGGNPGHPVRPTALAEPDLEKLKEVSDRLSALRVKGGRAMMDYAKRHLRGHLAYYAVSGNARSIRTYAYRISRLLFRRLNQRSQRRSVAWDRFGKILSGWMPSLRIQHNLYPKPLWMT